MKYHYHTKEQPNRLVEVSFVDNLGVMYSVDCSDSKSLEQFVRDTLVEIIDTRILERYSMPDPKHVDNPSATIELNSLDLIKIKIYRYVRETDLPWDSLAIIINVVDGIRARELILLSSDTTETCLRFIASKLRINL